jgi:hypothetical protein
MRGCVGILVLAALGCSSKSPDAIRCGAGTRLEGNVCVASTGAAAIADANAGSSQASKPPVAPISEDDVWSVAGAKHTEVEFANPSGAKQVFRVRKIEGKTTWIAQLTSRDGHVVASVDTHAETDSGTVGVKHFAPLAFVGLVRDQLVLVGGGDKLTGKAGAIISAIALRWDGTTLTETQTLNTQQIASEHDGADAGGGSAAPLPPSIHASMAKCETNRAMIGLDSVSITCHVDNPTPVGSRVHVVASYVSRNLAAHSGEADVLVPKRSKGETTVQLKDVDVGRSDQPHCECAIESANDFRGQ